MMVEDVGKVGSIDASNYALSVNNTTSTNSTVNPLALGSQGWTGRGLAFQTTPGSTAISYSYYELDYIDNLIDSLFSIEEKIKWLKDNNLYEEVEVSNFKPFNDHVKEKLKKILLAPKIKLDLKFPEGGDKL